ncbi:DEAD/DEAH box helicase domain protein [Nitzschia inconspicua]|uniref:RNA helicase n=1 Tax=Nitzschia inconspicua TaxID=303405 RepID=A0A9K3KQ12_9STRA|nr:DEAD/DEAH box helicase domain protein [Nitzschia inconspicua]
MADQKFNQKGYSYSEMSNKVEQADRSLIRGRAHEPTGEVESLRGRQDIGRMGDRVAGGQSGDGGFNKNPRPSELLNEKKKSKKQRLDLEANAAGSAIRKKSENAVAASGGRTILDLDNLTGYQPTTQMARAAYESLLATIGSKALLGNQSSSVLRDAAEEVIQVLKDPNLRDPERHDQISRLLTGKAPRTTSRASGGGLTSEQYANFVQLGKQLDDYDDLTRQQSSGQPNDEEGGNGERVDDEMGVAVVFDDSEDEGNDHGPEGASDIEDGVVVDSSSESESEDDELAAQAALRQRGQDGDKEENPDDQEDDEEKLVQGGDENKKKSHVQDRTLSVHEIDAHFLQRQLSKHISDAAESARLANEVLEVLDIRNQSDVRECENKLLLLLRFDMFDTIKLILNNRTRVWACVSMKRAQNDEERSDVEKALMDDSTGEGKLVWDEIHSKSRAADWSRERMRGLTDSLKVDPNATNVTSALDSIKVKQETEENTMDIDGGGVKQEDAIELDLDQLAFRDGSHTMSNKKCDLPDTSWRAMKKGYEEVHVPAVRSVIPKDERLISISELPKWTHSAFKGMDKLNRVQSKMCNIALQSSENLLLCAPTGAGKTNVACLAMLNILGQYRKQRSSGEYTEGQVESEEKELFDLNSFKIVYVAPMKALVQEVVKNFSHRLAEYGIVVRELSGDSSLTRQQIAETQLLVTTPEKWDIVTRQGEGRAYTQLIKLVIIDEIHLLHDDRGPVLESIVARVVRQVETTAEPIRLVGLSATLPNYADVATFLRVKPDKGLFFFDHSYRPVPLQMQYIGITERNAFKRFHLQNEICYEKALVQRENGNQMLIFVHSRAETGKTAKALRDIALERDELFNFVRDGSGTQEILRDEAAGAKNPDLKDVLPYGFAIHHAGMAREDRESVEELFADRHIAVLCTTATLAWGVNLPAHAVIIKGTQIYDPSKGRWAELSPLDVLQMLGRAGRPQYDSEGEGIIMTQHSELQYYLSLTNLQLPVESQLIKTLPDHLNAEVVLGTVQTLEEAAEWLSYTFLYIRMLRNPSLYGIPDGVTNNDPTLKQRRLDLAHTAATILERNHLIRYDRKSGAIQATPLGRVASQFYISHSSMAVYSRHMRPNMSDIELLRLFSLSGEFNHITVREEEKLELAKLAGKVPIPVKESPNEPSAKINILLQAYISRLKLDGFALVADMAFIQQSAARIMRCLFEISLRRNWSALAKLTLAFSNMVSHRIWRSQSPLRQFRNVPEVVSRKLERNSDIEWSRYPDLTASDLGELVGVPKMGRVLQKLVHQFPRVEITGAQIQPITRSLLRIELNLTPGFKFDVNVHGFVQLFHVIVEDVNCETILHHEYLSLKSSSQEEDHTLVFSVPILEPLSPAYFVRVISDKWLHSESVLPVSFGKMILPAKFPAPTELLDMQPLLPNAIGEQALSKLFPYKEFNPIQTQTFHELFKTDHNCLVCSPSGSGKKACAEFAIMRMLTSTSEGKCVYVAPSDEIADPVYEDWGKRFGSLIGSSMIARLSGEIVPDLKLIGSARIVVATVKVWDMITRRWRQRKQLHAISLVVFDEMHFLGGNSGPTMEVVISRMRYMSSQRHLENGEPLRMVGLSASLANARDVGDWFGVPGKSLFNFSPKVRPWPLEIYFQSFDQSNFSARLMAMAKPVYSSVLKHRDDKSAIIYVSSRRQAQLTAIDLMTYNESRGDVPFYDQACRNELMKAASEMKEPTLQQVMDAGIGFVHGGMANSDFQTVIEFFNEGKIKILVCPAELCWQLQCVAHLVVIMGTETYDGRERRHVDYKISDMLHMMGRHNTGSIGKCVIMCHHSKKETLKKLLYEPLPIESHLDSHLHDHIISECVTKTIETMQDAVDYLTWTFLYRRLPKNPTYYGLQGTSNAFISEFLSEMVETIMGDLEESKCIEINEEGEVTPLNLGMIAAYYYIQYKTVDIIASSVAPKTKSRGILEILSAAWEFSSLPLRYGEEKAIKMLARTQPYNLPDAPYDAHMKTLVLLQCHFSRTPIPADFRVDLRAILKEATKLVQAIVDVISSNGWLKPALAAMELSQMIVQGLWSKDNPLRQIPHFSNEIIERCEKYEGEEPIESVFDILSLDDDVRNDLLRLPEEKMADVAVFCNNYPNIEVSYEVQDQDNVTTGDPVQIAVQLEREVEEEEMTEEELAKLGTVSAPLYPYDKKEGWWIVVSDTSTNTLHALKRVNLVQKQKVLLEFLAPEEAGDYNLTLFCMSDSYLGCDQEYSLNLSVAQGDDDDDDSDGDSEE